MCGAFESGLSGLVSRAGLSGVLVAPGSRRWHGNHLDAIDRARGHAEITARAPIGQDSVHAFVGTHNGVDWAGIYTQRAANAVLLLNERYAPGARCATFWINGFERSVQERGEFLGALIGPRGAAVDVALAKRECLCVGFASIKTTLGALRLRQQRIDRLF